MFLVKLRFSVLQVDSLFGFFQCDVDDLESAKFTPGVTLCGQAEHLDGRGILPFDDEFLDEIALGVIQEKFGQGLS